MYSDISTESAQRITEIREHIHFISSNMPSPPSPIPRHLNTEKGLVFVELYGVIEYTILQTLSRTINILNSEQIALSQIKHQLWAMVLDSELESLRHVNSKKWDKRNVIFDVIKGDPAVVISEDIVPTDGKNFSMHQMKSIWRTFDLTEPLFHDIRFNSRMRDIVQNRINVAHGNLSASDVGASFTVSDLEARLNEVSQYCSYVISVFDEYIAKRKFES